MKRFAFRRSRRPVAALVSALGLLLAGCQIDQAPTPTVPPAIPNPLRCNVEVYCILGLANVFSLGLYDLSSLLRNEGVPAAVVSGSDVQALANSIVDARLKSGDTRPLVLTGHSYGADDCLRIAEILKSRSLTVDLIVLIDPSSPIPVPSNVDKCINFYLPTALGDVLPGIFAGNPIIVAPGNTHTILINQEVTAALGPELGQIDHFSLESSGTIHRLIQLEVFKLCPQN